MHSFLPPSRCRKIRMTTQTRGSWYSARIWYFLVSLLYLWFWIDYIVGCCAVGSSAKFVSGLVDTLNLDIFWEILLRGALIFGRIGKAIFVVKIFWFLVSKWWLELALNLIDISLINFFLRIWSSFDVATCKRSIMWSKFFSNSTAVNRWSFLTLFFKNFPNSVQIDRRRIMHRNVLQTNFLLWLTNRTSIPRLVWLIVSPFWWVNMRLVHSIRRWLYKCR